MLDLKIYRDQTAMMPLGEDETLKLGHALLPDGIEGYGEPVQLFVKNEGDAILVTTNINLEGEGATLMQLARDENGAHGIWAQPGQGIVALTNDIQPGEMFSFWVRGSFSAEDAPETKSFSFMVEMVGRH